MVRSRIAAALSEEPRSRLVSSASCGADLLALGEARRLNLDIAIVLPYSVADFRASSVTDRPGDWGPLFDDLIDYSAAQGGLIVLNESVASPRAYELATRTILREASETPSQTKIAMLVWNGARATSGDLTSLMARHAARAGFQVRDIPI
jgi:hypothetical protein